MHFDQILSGDRIEMYVTNRNLFPLLVNFKNQMSANIGYRTELVKLFLTCFSVQKGFPNKNTRVHFDQIFSVDFIGMYNQSTDRPQKDAQTSKLK